MRFGEKLSFLRKQRSMTQLELAEKLNISRQAVSRWEKGMSEPSTENLVSIGKLFDVSTDALLDEGIELQSKSTVLIVEAVEAEEKNIPEKHNKYSILKIIGIALLVIGAVLVVHIELRKNEQNPAPIEGINKDIVTESETVILPLN